MLSNLCNIKKVNKRNLQAYFFNLTVMYIDKLWLGSQKRDFQHFLSSIRPEETVILLLVPGTPGELYCLCLFHITRFWVRE